MYQECRHIKTTGVRCQSPALRGTPYCYFHARLHRLASAPKPSEKEPLKLPLLEDSHGIQIALAQVLDELGSSRLDPRRAGLFLYAIQIASQHVQRNQFIYKPDIVQSVDHSPEGEELAPECRVCDVPGDCIDCPDKDTCADYEPEDES